MNAAPAPAVAEIPTTSPPRKATAGIDQDSFESATRHPAFGRTRLPHDFDTTRSHAHDDISLAALLVELGDGKHEQRPR